MTERESIQRALEHLHASDDTLEEVLNVIDRDKTVKHLKRAGKNTLRTVLIAAVMVTLLTTTVWAAATGRVDLTVIESTLSSWFTGKDGERGIEYTFQNTDEDYIELGYWYPEALPEGYEEVFVSDYSWQQQSMAFENAEGKRIDFDYSIAGSWNTGSIEGAVETEKVYIHGNSGVLVTWNGGESNLLLWTDEERGIGFKLSCDGDVDLMAIAESVAQQDEGRPSTWESEQKEALEELGVYMPAGLPDGYELTETHAFSTSGSGWYGYVRRVFETRDHKQIYLAYETMGHADDISPEKLAEMPEPSLELHVGEARKRTEDYAVTDTTVWGVPAAVVERLDGKLPLEVSWYVEGAGPKDGMLFMMTADDLTADELVALAESVALQP